MAKRHEPHDLVAEIIRRAELPEDRYVIRISDPPTPFERLQLLSAHLQRRPHVIMPHPCRSFDEWHERCRRLFGP